MEAKLLFEDRELERDRERTLETEVERPLSGLAFGEDGNGDELKFESAIFGVDVETGVG
jgi:hypothetical protein